MTRNIVPFLRTILTGIVLLTQSAALQAQNLGAEITVNLDPSNFGLASLNPAPSQTGSGQVFGGSSIYTMPITIRQWSDGSVTVSTSSRYQTIDVSSGATSGTEISAGMSFTLKVVNGTFGVSSSSGTNVSASLSISNSLSFRMEGNVLIAEIKYTENGVTYTQSMSLGTVSQAGGFAAFPGKEDIIAGTSAPTIIQNYQPGTLNGAPGRRNTSASPVYAACLLVIG